MGEKMKERERENRGRGQCGGFAVMRSISPRHPNTLLPSTPSLQSFPLTLHIATSIGMLRIHCIALCEAWSCGNRKASRGAGSSRRKQLGLAASRCTMRQAEPKVQSSRASLKSHVSSASTTPLQAHSNETGGQAHACGQAGRFSACAGSDSKVEVKHRIEKS